jgi:META domain
MRLNHAPRHAVLAGMAVVLLAAVLMACSSPVDQPTTAAGFAGYKWAVESISHDGKTTPVPEKYSVYLQFTPDGHFGANEPVNYHSGRYRVTQGGFTTNGLAQTLAAYAGRDPVVLLSVSAMSAFNNQVHALANVSGSTLTVTVGSYKLTAQRDGGQANF